MTLEKLIFLLLRDDSQVREFIKHVCNDKNNESNDPVEFDAKWKPFLYLLDGATSDNKVSKASITKFVDILKEIKSFFDVLIPAPSSTPVPSSSQNQNQGSTPVPIPVPSSTSSQTQNQGPSQSQNQGSTPVPSSISGTPLPPDGDYTQIYMFYNNDNNKLKMHVYNKDNNSKSFYESFKDVSEDVDEQLSSVSDYIYNKQPTTNPQYYKVDISGKPENIQYDKTGPISEQDIQQIIN